MSPMCQDHMQHKRPRPLWGGFLSLGLPACFSPWQVFCHTTSRPQPHATLIDHPRDPKWSYSALRYARNVKYTPDLWVPKANYFNSNFCISCMFYDNIHKTDDIFWLNNIWSWSYFIYFYFAWSPKNVEVPVSPGLVLLDNVPLSLGNLPLSLTRGGASFQSLGYNLEFWMQKWQVTQQNIERLSWVSNVVNKERESLEQVPV